MDCVNHAGANAAAYCQNCGKAMCANCVRTTPARQILCEPCLTAWQSYPQPFGAAPPGTPSPAAAAVLGIIPGVGAMYNGQFMKGLVHVVVFAALVSATRVWSLFGILIAGWIFYQIFDAYHTARARRDGEPLPDPLGLNEVGNWFGTGGHAHTPPPPTPGPSAGNPAGGAQQTAYHSAYHPAYQPYQQPPQGEYAPPAAGFANAGVPPVPPMPPAPPVEWRRREPVGAVVLIALGVLLLLAEFGIFPGRIFGYLWPLLLIALGVWLIARRLEDSRGGSR